MHEAPRERRRVVLVLRTEVDTDDDIETLVSQLDDTDLVTLVNVRPGAAMTTGAMPMLGPAAMTMTEIGWRMYADACIGDLADEKRIAARIRHHSAALRAAGIGHAIETVLERPHRPSRRTIRRTERAIERIARRFRADVVIESGTTTTQSVPSRTGVGDHHPAVPAAELHRSEGSPAPIAS